MVPVFWVRTQTETLVLTVNLRTRRKELCPGICICSTQPDIPAVHGPPHESPLGGLPDRGGLIGGGLLIPVEIMSSLDVAKDGSTLWIWLDVIVIGLAVLRVAS